jgi:hypothetical protein
MTKKKPGAKRGRPPKDANDKIVRELALAFELIRGLGPQQARDMALACLEGIPDKPTKLPRGNRKAPARSRLTAFVLPHATIKGREGAIAKNRRGGLVRPDVVRAWIDVLRATNNKELIHGLQALVDALSA